VRTRWRVPGNEIVSRPVNRRPARGRGPHWSNVLASSCGGRCGFEVRENLTAGRGAAAGTAAVDFGGTGEAGAVGAFGGTGEAGVGAFGTAMGG
jgi:hypothetical protein